MTRDFSQWIAEARAIASDARREFGRLTPAQLNWKPAPEQWSVAQCLDHLIRIDSAYWPVFRRIEEGTYAPGLARRLPLLPRLFGSLVLKSVEPDAPRKYKTSKRVEPATGDLDAGIVDRFVAHQDDLIEHMRKLGERDAADVIVPSPLLSIVSYSLRDALRIIVAHERRHLGQARRVLETPGFPAAP